MRFAVPQFIEIEDKIIGPFTWRQFVWLMGGVGGAVILFIMTPFIIFVIFGIPLGSLGILLAFYPVNNRPFSVFLESMVTYAQGAKLYLWRKQGTGIYGKAETADDTVGALINQNAYTPNVTGKNLQSLSRNLALNALDK